MHCCAGPALPSALRKGVILHRSVAVLCFTRDFREAIEPQQTLMANPIKTPEQLLAYRPLKDLLAAKGKAVHGTKPTDSVFAALQLMEDHGIGFLVVMDGARLVGVLSERDYARKVVLKNKSSRDTPVREIMTEKVVTVTPEETIPQCMALMNTHGIRHLPVMDGGTVIGVLSIRDLLKATDFRPIIHNAPGLMDARIFRPGPMGLRDILLSIPLDRRFTYEPEHNLFFVNFERLTIRSQADIDNIREEAERKLKPLGRKVYAIVNYDNATILPDVLEAYTQMVHGLMNKYYWGVTRYSTSSFLRIKLGNALKNRGVAPHIYESAEEARGRLREIEHVLPAAD